MAVGAFRTATDIVDEAVAGAFAVNRTDLRLIQALQVAGQLTAGQLASSVGLSPAATTTAIGRLVTAGHATRIRNDCDRRQTLVSLTPSALAMGDQAFGVMVQAGRGVLRRYTRDQLLVIQDFVQRARRVEITHAEKLANRAPTPRNRPTPAPSPAGYSRPDGTDPPERPASAPRPGRQQSNAAPRHP